MKRYDCIIWGTWSTYSKLRTLCMLQPEKIRIVGVVTSELINGYIDGYVILRPDELVNIHYDYILLPSVGGGYPATVANIKKITGCDSDKIVSYDVMNLPGFTFEKYKELRESRPTILTRNCMGGYLYHLFRLEFYSPTINMFIGENDFLKFASNLDWYLQQDLNLVGSRFDSGDKIWYPVFKLNDITWFMNHYKDFELAKIKWEERKKRINKDNICVVFHTNSKSILEKFELLPFKKKICFVPFKSDSPSAWYLPEQLRKDGPKNAEWTALRVSDGNISAYDLWDMLLYGKKTPRMSFLENVI